MCQILPPAAFFISSFVHKKYHSMNNKFLSLIILSALGFIVFLLIVNNTMVTIPSGNAGVLYRKFGQGTVTDRTYGEGVHFIAPWNTMFQYSVRTQEVEEKMEVLSANGLSIKVDVSIRFSPQQDKLGIIHQTIGQNYMQKIIIPEVRSSTRRIIGQYTPEELYSSRRDSIQKEVFTETKKRVVQKNLILDALLIRSVELPPTIQVAIENKLKQEQESEEYEFRISKEQKEAERKRIEAEGIKAFQDIVSKGITDELLRWKGIEATLELSKSENAKVVVVGAGKSGLPLILGESK